MNTISTDLFLVMPEAMLLLSTTIILIIGIFAGRVSEAVSYWLSLASLIVLLVLIFKLFAIK